MEHHSFDARGGGCLRGMFPPQKLGNFVFLRWNRAIWWILLDANLEQVMIRKKKQKNRQFYGPPDWPKFSILGKILVKILLESLEINQFSFLFFFFLRFELKHFHLCTTLGGGWLHRPSPSQIFKIYAQDPNWPIYHPFENRVIFFKYSNG